MNGESVNGESVNDKGGTSEAIQITDIRACTSDVRIECNAIRCATVGSTLCGALCYAMFDALCPMT